LIHDYLDPQAAPPLRRPRLRLRYVPDYGKLDPDIT
jgi:hypothetical protein